MFAHCLLGSIPELVGSSRKLCNYLNFRELTGAQGRNRTTDTLIFSQVLYRLSYLGTGLKKPQRFIALGRR